MHTHSAASLALPIDVRLMNFAASVLLAGLSVFGIAALLAWGARQPIFALQRIVVQGDVSHSDPLTLRANVAPRLRGTFFTLDLAQAKAVFEAQPWVRKAVVRREFPSQLRVTLQAHQASAYWGAEGEYRLINNFGEVFEANLDEVEPIDLPRLSGPEGQGLSVLVMYQTLKPLFDQVDQGLDQVELSGGGLWRVKLDSGAELELGRGNAQELVPRTTRFLKTFTQAASVYGRSFASLETADLRYPQGYAMRLRGVSTAGTNVTQK